MTFVTCSGFATQSVRDTRPSVVHLLTARPRTPGRIGKGQEQVATLLLEWTTPCLSLSLRKCKQLKARSTHSSLKRTGVILHLRIPELVGTAGNPKQNTDTTLQSYKFAIVVIKGPHLLLEAPHAQDFRQMLDLVCVYIW